MVNIKNIGNTFLLFSLIYFATEQKAHAYIDPNTGSYLFQIVLASLLGGSYVFKSNIANFFNGIKSKVIKSESEKTTKTKRG